MQERLRAAAERQARDRAVLDRLELARSLAGLAPPPKWGFDFAAADREYAAAYAGYGVNVAVPGWAARSGRGEITLAQLNAELAALRIRLAADAGWVLRTRRWQPAFEGYRGDALAGRPPDERAGWVTDWRGLDEALGGR